MRIDPQGRPAFACLGLMLGLLGLSTVAAASLSRLEFLGEARLPAGLTVDGVPVGGLSAITYDSEQERYYVVSDDPSGRAPARFFTVKIDLDDGRLRSGAVEVLDATVIQGPDGEPMAKLTVDPEGIALADDTLYISSEGQVKRQVAPFVRRFGLDGSFRGELPLPEPFDLGGEPASGPRHNLGFEALTLTPDRTTLFAGMENALVQDGPVANLERGSRSRILRYDTTTSELVAQYLYVTEPVAKPAGVAGGLAVNGLVDFVALGGEKLLSMERSYSFGIGNTVRLFVIDLEGATDISPYPALSAIDLAAVHPVRKRLLLDLAELDLYLDNLEGLCFGPTLSDGRRALILVSDDNFNPVIQVGQLLAFAVDDQPIAIEDVQGAAHRSPMEGDWVFGVGGRVTGLVAGESPGFWLEDEVEDGDPATSRGLLVRASPELVSPRIGDRVEVDGRVVEDSRREDELTMTTLLATAAVLRSEDGESVPPGVRIGPGGSRMPTEVVDDDALEVFEPFFDGVDFWESLEGMRIVLDSPVVVGPTSLYGEVVIAADPRSAGDSHSQAGGLLLRPGDLNPERLVVAFPDDASTPNADVGDRFLADLTGILSYGHGAYRLLAEGTIPDLETKVRDPETTDLVRAEDRLTIATFNVRNLSARSESGRFTALARQIVAHLAAPDILALQEIQDDTGPEDDGTVAAAETLARLIQAIEEEGGPRYDYRQIDPQNNHDGGQLGANIRVVFLYDPERLEFPERIDADAASGVAPCVLDGPGLRLLTNPCRLGSSAAAFTGDPAGRFSPSRKPLIGQVDFAGRPLFLINLHLSSKSGDSRIFGAIQPPRRRTEDQRSQQARLVADWVAALLAADPEAAVVVLGDLNELGYATPVRILEATPLEDLTGRIAPDDRYTFVFNGNSQLLDHVLVSPGLDRAADLSVDIVHLNADKAEYGRASDHDPIVVEVGFTKP